MPNKYLSAIVLSVVLLLMLGSCATTNGNGSAAPVEPANTQPSNPTEAISADTPPESPAEVISEVSFSGDVQPILNSRCSACHGANRQSGNLDLSNYSGVMAGSIGGAVVSPGSAGSSPLVTLAESGVMPKQGPKLNPEQLQVLIDWVNQGAKDN